MEKYLTPDEQVVYATPVHWRVYFSSLVFLAGWFILHYLKPEALGHNDHIIENSLISFAALLFLRAFYIQHSTTFFVTNKRILIKQDFITLSTKGMPLQQIESIDVRQSILGRIFNYGTMTIHGTGASQILLNNIPDPFEFRKLLITSMKDFKN